MSITNIDNRFIHYEALGRGQPVIFLHGWLGSWRYWWPSMQALSTQYRSFAFDLWGFGDSTKATTEQDRNQLYSFKAYTELLGCFIEQLGIKEPITLVGHALGAIVALNYAAKNPEQIAKVAAVSLPTEGAAIHQRLQTLDPATFVNRTFGRGQSFNEVTSEIQKTDPAAPQRLAQELAFTDLTAMLTETPQALLAIYGGKDVVIQPPSNNHRPTTAVSQHFVALPDCHHFPMLQEPAKFNRLLLEFIRASEKDLGSIAPKEYWQRRTR